MRTASLSRRLLAVGLAALVAAACGGSAGSNQGSSTSTTSGPVTITFWDTNAGPDRTPVWQELIRRFEAANPTITVSYVGLPISQQLQKLQAAVISGAVPDVANPTSNFLAGLVAQGGLLPLDSRFDSWSGRSDIPASVIQGLRGMVPDKKLYAIPFSGNTTILYYRKDWIAQHNLKPPTNWTDFYADVQALNAPQNGVYGFGLRGGSGSVGQLESWMVSAAGLTSYYDSKGSSTLASSAAVGVVQKAVDWYGKTTPKDDINHGYQEMAAEFDSGHVAMIMHNLGSYPQHVKALGAANVGAVVLPALGGGRHVLLSSSNISAMVFKGSKHQDAAWKFASFLGSADAAGYFNQQIGQIPPNTSLANAQWVKDSPGIQSALATQKLSSTTYVNPPWYLPDYTAIETQMEPAFQKTLLGQESAQAFATDMANRLTTSKRQYDQAHK